MSPISKAALLGTALVVGYVGYKFINKPSPSITQKSDAKPEIDHAKKKDSKPVEALAKSQEGDKKDEASIGETAKPEAEKKSEPEVAKKEEDQSPKAEKSSSTEDKKPVAMGVDSSRVVAILPDGTKKTMDDVQKALMGLPPELRNAPFGKIYEALLYRLVDMDLLYKAAVDSKLDQASDTAKKIDDAKEAVVQKAFLDGQIEKKATTEVLRKKFDEIVATLDKNEVEIRVRQITFRNKEEAEKSLAEIKSGKKKFDDLLSLSVDEPSKKNRGDIGYIRKGDVPKDFWEALFTAANDSQSKDKVVKSIQKVGEFYLVCKVEDKQTVKPPKFEDVKDNVRDAMKAEFAVQVIKDLRSESRKKGLELIGLDGKPLSDEDIEKKEKEDKKDKKKKDKSSVDISKLDPKMVVAKLPNKETITLKEIQDSQQTLPPQLKDVSFEEVYSALLLRAVDMKLISHEARSKGFENDEQVKHRQEDVRKLALQKAYVDMIVKKEVKPEMLKERYNETIKILPKDEMEVRLRMIVIKDKVKAESLYQEIKGSSNGKKKFDDSVTLSEDEPTKKNNGDLGYVRREQLPSSLADIVFKKAAKATLLPEVISLGDAGYAIVRVEDKQLIAPPSFKELEPNLMKQVAAMVAMKHVEKLRQGTKLFDMDGKPMTLKDMSAALNAAPGAGSAPTAS